MPQVRIAILDLYKDEPNEGMRAIHEIIKNYARHKRIDMTFKVYDVRGGGHVPGLEYDLYISTGGPGSPLESEGSVWEARYFALMEQIKAHNRISSPERKKFVFLICHSFQVFIRYYDLATVSPRKSNSFGVFPVHSIDNGNNDPFYKGLANPFWAADSRDYQVVQPRLHKIREGGGKVLCIEKYRPHVPLERAVMSIRFDDAFFGTQFHPEADPNTMHKLLQREDKKNGIIKHHGIDKYYDILEHLEDPEKLQLTYNTVLPSFLEKGLKNKHALLHQ